MSNINQIKSEARQLFEEVNNGCKKTYCDNESPFCNPGLIVKNTFKHRIKELRKRAVALKLINAPFINGSR